MSIKKKLIVKIEDSHGPTIETISKYKISQNYLSYIKVYNTSARTKLE